MAILSKNNGYFGAQKVSFWALDRNSGRRRRQKPCQGACGAIWEQIGPIPTWYGQKTTKKSLFLAFGAIFGAKMDQKSRFLGSRSRFWAPAAPKTLSGRLRRHFGSNWSNADLIRPKNNQKIAIFGPWGHFWRQNEKYTHMGNEK